MLRTALSPDQRLEPRERLFLDTYASIVGHALPAADPQPVRAQNVLIDGSHQRKRLIQLAAIATLLSNPVRPASVAFLKDLSQQLATRDPVIDVIDALQKGNLIKVRMLAMRRAFRVMLKEAYLAEGAMGVIRVFAAMWLNAPV